MKQKILGVVVIVFAAICCFSGWYLFHDNPAGPTEGISENSVKRLPSGEFEASRTPKSIPSPEQFTQKLRTRSEDLLKKFKESGVAESRLIGEAIERALNNFEDGMRFIEENAPPQYVENYKYQVLSFLANDNLEYLHKGLLLLKNPNLKRNLIGSVLATWSTDDPDGLVFHFDKMESSEMRTQAFSGAITSYVRRDKIAEAWRAFEKMPESNARDSAVAEIMTTLAAHSLDAGIEWANRQSDKKLKTNAQALIARQMITNGELDRAADYASTISSQEVQSEIVNQLARQLAKGALDKGRNWLAQLPPETRVDAERNFIGVVAETNLDAGTQQALNIKNPKTKYEAIEEIREVVISQNDFSIARHWITTLPAELQPNIAYQISLHFKGIDRNKTEAWAKGIQIQTYVRERLRVLDDATLHHFAQLVREKAFRKFG